MPVIPAALVVIVVGGFFLLRRADVRLVLLLSAAALYLVHASQTQFAGLRFAAFSEFFLQLAKQMVYAGSVIPICSAMGFAYVCKLTGCDAHLVHLLCSPLKRVRWLLIPGGIAVAFIVNSAIVSQTSTVAVVGPVLIPLVVAAGISRQTAGAMTLLGGSMGGELLNPAAVEVGAINSATSIARSEIIRHIRPYNLLACGTALLVFWMMALLHERKLRDSAGGVSDQDDEIAPAPGSIAATMANNGAIPIDRVNPFKAMVPLVPIALLMFVKPLIAMPETLRTTKDNPIGEQAAIAAAMVIGVACAGLSAPRRISSVAAAFFEGAGFAYANVVSLIVAAMVFGESIQANGIVEMMTPAVKDAPILFLAVSIAVPWLMASFTGTAVGTAPAVIKILVPIAMAMPDPSLSAHSGLRAGALNAIGAQFGRTTSPVASVVMVSAALAHARPITLVKRIIIPLIAGGVVLFIAAIIGK